LRLLALRDVIGEGHDNDSEAYVSAKANYNDQRSRLIDLMRTDVDQIL
jgi:hypothetical protein